MKQKPNFPASGTDCKARFSHPLAGFITFIHNLDNAKNPYFVALCV